jgi:chemotaxis protein methyltransferase CheR
MTEDLSKRIQILALWLYESRYPCLTLMHDHQCRILLHHPGLSWTGYRKVRKGVKRRISRHMLGLNCSDMAGYLHELDRSTEAKAEGKRLMTVSGSRFFRDSRWWDLLYEKILHEGPISYLFKKKA